MKALLTKIYSCPVIRADLTLLMGERFILTTDRYKNLSCKGEWYQMVFDIPFEPKSRWWAQKDLNLRPIDYESILTPNA